MSQVQTLVAVYGTLKVGYENYTRFLTSFTPVFRGLVRVPYRMFENGHYPMLVADRAPHPVYVEVFEVDPPTLAELDALEEPYNYRRETFFLQELGRNVEIYVYAEREPPVGFTLVESGDWSK